MRPRELPSLITFLLTTACCLAKATPALSSPQPDNSHGAFTSNATDQLALMSFRSHVRSDPSRALESWGNHSIPVCRWRGVECGRRGLRRGRLTALDLPGLNLLGRITPELGNLTYLGRLHLPGNRLSGALPTELGGLLDLRHLDISGNALEGQIPPSLANCQRLEMMELYSNKLQREIPHQLGLLKNLQVLSLGNNTLTGSIPSSIGNLQNLRILNVAFNNLTGEIPSEIGKLNGLIKLNVRSNQLVGSIPSTLGNLSALTRLNLAFNKLTGGFPPVQGLSSLSILELGSNNLTGRIPSWLGNLSSLTILDLQKNSFVGHIPESLGNLKLLTGFSVSFSRLTGSIPNSLGNLHNLVDLFLDNNELEGSLPPSVFNLSSLKNLNVQNNHLEGPFPPDLGSNLPNLETFSVDRNKFHGAIPPGLCNTSMIRWIQMQANFFSGAIPDCFGIQQKNLSILSFADNQLEDEWNFLSSLTNCSNLIWLDVASNKIHGELPDLIGNLSRNVFFLNMQFNNIRGKIPESIGNLASLRVLAMDNNYFVGSVPSSIGSLKKLNTLDLSNNNLSGSIPVTFGNLTVLSVFYSYSNALSGGIPSSLSNCPLESLSLSYNKLTGPIPKELFLISTLSNYFHLDHNLLTGSIPSEVGNLKNLRELDCSSNRISGEIPLSIGNCQSLQFLNTSENLIHGVIPLTVGQLNGLSVVDLSYNNLSGRIPDFLGKLRGLTSLNLSFNSFEGEVPKDGIFLNTTSLSIVGNNGLCGGIPQLKLPLCSRNPTKMLSRKKVMTISMAAGILSVILVFLLSALTHWRSKSRREKPQESLVSDQRMRVTYAELVNATNEFSSENLIGVGSFGSVYKARMMNHDQQLVVAVKVFNLQTRGAFKSFDAECETMRCVRHRNLLKVLTVCSSTDFRGDDFKALIYEFLPNGNLHEWLHLHPEGEGENRVLDLVQRISIAIDVASAVDYLHHHNPFPIIHCDLKPTNVLLDNNLVAQVGDFGLARFLHDESSGILEQSTSWAALRGTIGYAAPEYGQGNNASTQGDVYSFGILLLEMFTRRRPTENEFAEGSNLHKYVEMALPDRAIDVIDQHLLSVTEDDEGTTRDNQNIREKENRLHHFNSSNWDFMFKRSTCRQDAN